MARKDEAAEPAPVDAPVEEAAAPDISKGTLKAVASELDISGRSSMDAPALAQAIVETVQPVAQPAFSGGPAQTSYAADFPQQPPAGQLPQR